MNAVKISARSRGSERTKTRGTINVKLPRAPAYRDDGVVQAHMGMFFQRCGGGKRVLRKLIGSGN